MKWYSGVCYSYRGYEGVKHVVSQGLEEVSPREKFEDYGGRIYKVYRITGWDSSSERWEIHDRILVPLGYSVSELKDYIQNKPQNRKYEIYFMKVGDMK